MIHRPDQPKKRTRHLWPVAFTILLIGIVATAGLTAASSLQTSAGAPPAQTLAAALPPTTCSLVGNTRTCDLWAKTGTLTLPGAVTVPFWGFSDTQEGAAQLPGPVIIANQGEVINVTLHNTLNQAASLAFPSQSLPPDITGAVSGNGTKTYSFTVGTAGTQLYEAGLTANGPRQVAMGMYGALIVRPAGAPDRLYASSASFAEEALLVFSELDPALNTSPDPLAFNMRNYSPKYWLINGQSYPMTARIGVSPGDSVALRYINAGVYDHSIGTLGLKETIFGSSGNALSYPHRIVAETLPAGQSLDLQTVIPSAATPGARFALYSGDRHLDNAGKSTNKILDMGGMLTFLEVTGTSTGDKAGPKTSGLTINPAISAGNTDLTLTANISDVNTGNANVAGAGYRFDTVGGPTPDTAITPISGTFGSPDVTITFTIPAASLAGLTGGDHTVFVRGSDDVNPPNLGGYTPIKFSLDKSGPQSSGTLNRTSFNGTQDLVFTGSANDSTTGNSAVSGAEYFLDTVGADGTGTALTGSFGTPVVTLDLTVNAATIGALPDGAHTLKVHSLDALNQWGPVASLNFTVDHQGPTASNLVIAPNPNNGSQVFDVNNLGVKVTAALADTSTNIAGGELFIDSVQAPGSGLPLQPTDSGFNSLNENVYTLILLTAGIQNLPEGQHTIYVRGQDVAGNWGSTASSILNIDKTGPVITTPTAAFSANPTVGARTVTMTVTASDVLTNGVVSNIAAGEWFMGADPGKGNGTVLNAVDGNFNSLTELLRTTINTCNLSGTDNIISMRAKDLAGNWGPIFNLTLTLSSPSPTIFEDSFASNNFNAWCSTTGATANGQNTMTVIPGASLNGTPARGMQVTRTANNNAPRYVTDNTPANEGVYSARFYFNPRTVTLGPTTIVDILDVMNTGGTTPIVRVQWRRSGTTNQVRAVVRNTSNNNTESATPWVNISAAGHYIEINWDSATRNNSTFKLYVDGVASSLPTSNTIDRRNFKVDAVSMGIVNVQGPNFAGTVYFDAFKSTKGGNVGP